MQKSVKFVKENLKINMLKIRHLCHYYGEYRDASYSIFNLKYILPKEIPIFFHNGSNYDQHFLRNELVEKSEG